jgi:hypothetical protein
MRCRFFMKASATVDPCGIISPYSEPTTNPRESTPDTPSRSGSVSQTWFLKQSVLLLTLLILIGSPPSSLAGNIPYTDTFTNPTGVVVYDLTVVYYGSGGSIAHPVVTKNSGPGDAPIFLYPPMGPPNGVFINWTDGGLKIGGSVTFTFTSMFPITGGYGIWSDANGDDIPGSRTASTIPEPTSFLMATIASLAGLAYGWSRHRQAHRRQGQVRRRDARE